ncbi:hypothetical protein SAMN05421754_100332 [Nitrosomonas sp. Nm58]|nr:hypothetical protein SAMN05421754_100332 [Nitrosomonas sp. Nm58]
MQQSAHTLFYSCACTDRSYTWLPRTGAGWRASNGHNQSIGDLELGGG